MGITLPSCKAVEHRLPRQTDQHITVVLACTRTGERFVRHRT